MPALEDALEEAGGAGAPPAATARLRKLLSDALSAGYAELQKARSGYGDPVRVAFAPYDDGLAAVVPLDAGVRADADALSERDWKLAAAAVGALVDALAPGAVTRPEELALRAGELDARLVLHIPGAAEADTADLAALAFDERIASVDRLRTRALAIPAALLADAAGTLRPPIGAGHPLRVAEAVARLGGDPVDPDSADVLDDALAGVLGADSHAARPHADPDPARRVARRILQRLSGMGKWGGYHTAFEHLPRGFRGNDRALATAVGEALLEAGLLAEKPSVGQRHVYLNSRRAGEIHRFIDSGEPPAGLALPH